MRGLIRAVIFVGVIWSAYWLIAGIGSPRSRDRDRVRGADPGDDSRLKALEHQLSCVIKAGHIERQPPVTIDARLEFRSSAGKRLANRAAIPHLLVDVQDDGKRVHLVLDNPAGYHGFEMTYISGCWILVM